MSSILDKFYKDLESPRRSVQSLAIGISRNGNCICEELDEKPYNHAVAFNYIASQFGLVTLDTLNPMEAGENLAKQGILAIQIRNDICIGYFPIQLDPSQYERLEIELSEYDNLGYQFKECSQIEGYVSRKAFLQYAKSITIHYNDTNHNELIAPKKV